MIKRCEHCDKWMINPWSYLATYGIWHVRCLKNIHKKMYPEYH